jgi:putative hydrolase of the HAD superfamily
LFVDIGGVLLSDGWDHHARERAAAQFQLDFAELDEIHHVVFASYEEGKLTLEDYLSRTVFHEERAFTRDQFRQFMFAQSQPYPKMLELMARLKPLNKLKIVVVSNEARELNAYRIRKFRLDAFVDEMVEALHQISPFDPEHLPGEILLIEGLRRRSPELPQVACSSDTSVGPS